MKDIYIVSACRTPIGKFGGAYSPLTAVDLGAIVIEEALKRAALGSDDIEEVFMGNVLQAGQGQNPARQSAIKAKLNVDVPCTTINMVCGSGLKSIIIAAQAIKSNDSQCIIAGGMELMSKAPYVLSRRQSSLGDLTISDDILCDGLKDAFHDKQMGLLCEKLAEIYNVTRKDQDNFSYTSQQRYASAYEQGKFTDEIIPVLVSEKKETKLINKDEHPRSDTSLDALSKLRPAFDPSGTITAGNSSGINDGAAAVVLVSSNKADSMTTPPLGRIISWATYAVEPELFGIAPKGAVLKALDKANLSLDEIGLIESNEAFAVQTISLGRELDWDWSKVNVNGGAIALGHPIGASGARIVVTLLYEMKRRGERYGLATTCIGGGMGVAMIVEAMNQN